jgi:hypothetical protein
MCVCVCVCCRLRVFELSVVYVARGLRLVRVRGAVCAHQSRRHCAAAGHVQRHVCVARPNRHLPTYVRLCLCPSLPLPARNSCVVCVCVSSPDLFALCVFPSIVCVCVLDVCAAGGWVRHRVFVVHVLRVVLCRAVVRVVRRLQHVSGRRSDGACHMQLAVGAERRRLHVIAYVAPLSRIPMPIPYCVFLRCGVCICRVV